MESKRGVIPSKRILYPYTPLEIKAAKRKRKDTFKASSSIDKSKITMPLSLSCTDVQCARATGEQYKPKKLEVFRNEECLINIIKGFSILTSLPWHLVDEVYFPINCGDEFHWVLAVVILKERHIQVYYSMSQRRCFEPSSEIQKLAKILPTYLDMSGFLDQKVRTDWNGGLFVAAYAEYLRDGLQVPNNGLDAGLLHKISIALLWKYGEVKAQKLYASDIKDPRRPKLNFAASYKEQLVHIE
ncbi:hypothetical protein BC332_25244 [Capsicum chinense]|nr:hypothetical protein BC332_25244 [Capsicum chinense]